MDFTSSCKPLHPKDIKPQRQNESLYAGTLPKLYTLKRGLQTWQVHTPEKRHREEPASPAKIQAFLRRKHRKQLVIPAGPSELSPFQLSEITRLVREAREAAEKEGRESVSGNLKHVAYAKKPVPFCTVCGAGKHHVKWGETRTSLRTMKAVVRGSQCYACTRAALCLHAACRAVSMYSQVEGAMDVWGAKSALIRSHLRSYQGDTCACSECTD